MIRAMFGSTTLVGMLRSGLDEASATHRGIAANVARAVSSSSSGDFAAQLDQATGAPKTEAVDLEREMVRLADTQLRYESSAKLLHEAYAQWRTAIHDRG